MEIANTIIEKQDRDGMLRRSLERIIQLYTDKSHFVYELLQNAEDSQAKSIRFVQYEDRLEVFHDGHAFTRENLQGLCDIGKSDKINNLNQIGEFGVGFKSVFGICETVLLYSSPRKEELAENCFPFSVKIKDFTHPVDIDYKPVEENFTTKFVFPYKIGFNFSGFKSINALNDTLSGRLKNLGVTTLLFMKHIESIEYEISLDNEKVKGAYVLEKQPVNDHCSFVSSMSDDGNGENDFSYLLFSRKIDSEQSYRSVDIAFPIKQEKDKSYSFQKAKNPFISVYFPTETESKLSFIVQGPFRTTPNRSSVPADETENKELAELTASLYKDSVIELRDLGYLNLSFLQVMPVVQDNFENYGLFYPLYEATRELVQDEDILPCKNGSYCNKGNALIARSQELPDVFSDELITELINDGKEYHWLPTVITETGPYRNAHRYLTFIMGINEIRPEGLRDYFNKNTAFLKQRDTAWLCRLYRMYEAIPNVFSEKNNRNILNAVIVKTATGEFVAPYRKVEGKYLPNAFLPSKKVKDEEISIVAGDVYKECGTFFRNTLHLQEPNEYEYFIKSIKKRYRSNVNIPDVEHCADVKTLARYKRDTDYAAEVATVMRNEFWLKCCQNGEKVLVVPGEATIYYPQSKSGLSIEGYFKNIAPETVFIDFEFYATNGISFDDLSEFGVTDHIVINDGSGWDQTYGEYYTGNSGRMPQWTTSGNFRWRLSIENLEDALIYISNHPKEKDAILKSQTIFKLLLENRNRLIGTVYIGGSTTPNKYNEPAAIIKTLLDPSYMLYAMRKWDGKWLYTESMELVSSKEISKYDLNTSIYGQVDMESSIYELLEFRKNKVEQKEEVVRDYDSISEERKNSFFEIELERRYGITVADLNLTYGSGSSTAAHPSKSDDTDFEFPSSAVKNWDALKKHAAQVLCYASPVVYAPKVMSIRVSRPQNDIRAYLMNTYRAGSSYKYACQMCHKPRSDVEMCQIEKNPDVELDPLNVCLCRNCAQIFRKYRNVDFGEALVSALTDLSDSDIQTNDPVSIRVADKEIWFTQTHAAEIRELLKLKCDSKDTQKASTTEAPRYNQYIVKTGTNNQSNGSTKKKKKGKIAEKTMPKNPSEYNGHRIYHKTRNAYGRVMGYSADSLIVNFESGPRAGKNQTVDFKECISGDLIRIVD